ncbi:MAG: FadR/GntR family transcriptional regulator [Pseudomonadota bacterium]
MTDVAKSLSLSAPMRDWSLADQVHERILSLIVDGTFAENTKLPPEQTLSENLGVSRPVLRQALKRLRDDGVLISRQGSGSFVKKRPESALFAFSPVSSFSDIRRVFEFRAAIEGDAAAAAAQRASKQDCASMVAAMIAVERSASDDGFDSTADAALHMAIAEASGNPFFSSALASMKANILACETLRRTFKQHTSSSHPVIAEHRMIVDAIVEGDEAVARQSMREHIDATCKRLFDGPDAF